MILNTRKKGRSGEALAVKILKKRGCKILEQNFTCPLGEIDIIAKQGDTLVFVEVKTRLSASFGPAKLSVTPAKQKKISLAALFYVTANNLNGCKSRFDVVAVDEMADKPFAEVIENAFECAVR